MTLGPAYGGGAGGAAADTNDYIRVSESTTDTQLGSGTGAGTAVDVNFDTVDENTDTGNFSLASEVITVLDAGEYRIEYMLSYVIGSSDVRQMATRIEIDPNTSTYAKVDETFYWNAEDNDERATASGFTIQTLVASSKVKLTVQRNVGTVQTNVDRAYTQLSITRISA